MAPSLEHDYIGRRSEVPQMEARDKLPSAAAEPEDHLHSLRETELRLGLPGSESPERREKEEGAGLTLGLPKGFVAGAKRGFSDAIDGSGKWIFSGGSGSEVELGKGGGGGGGLFSPRGEGSAANYRKEPPLVPMATGQENKGQISPGGAERGGAPAAKCGKALEFVECGKRIIGTAGIDLEIFDYAYTLGELKDGLVSAFDLLSCGWQVCCKYGRGPFPGS